ncbi:MAG: hypothetical protein HUU13_18675 [Burkholderiaceae bacterium]|nr:hypothetical protein [Burkholderiaceae bacterium]
MLGRSVDLAFEVQPDPGQTVAQACITAEILSGAVPVSRGRVRVTPLPEVPGRASMVRVQSSAIVDEPVLTVTLLAGCNGKTSRTYTFLADPPASMTAGTRPIVIPRVEMPEDVSDATAPTGLGAGTGSRSGKTSENNGPLVPVSRRPQAAQAPAPSKSAAALAPTRPSRPLPKADSKVKAPEKEALGPRSRLVMEPLENWLESPSTLRLSTELNLPDTPATPEQREQAQAQWKALSMHPEDLLKEGARMAALNGELAQLRTPCFWACWW